MELDILSFLSTRENYTKYISYIKPHTLTQEVYTIVKDIDIYFNKHKKLNVISWSDFSLWFCAVQHSAWSEDKLNVFKTIFTRLEKHTVPVDSTIVDHFVMVDYATQVFHDVSKVAEGGKNTLDETIRIVDEYKSNASVDDPDNIILDDISSIEEVVKGTGLKWRMENLNKSLGKLSNDLIMVGGRPDSGKTTLLASEVTHFAPQIPKDKYILWFNNEERGSKVKMRLLQSALAVTKEDIERNPKQAMEDYQTICKGEGRIVIKDAANITTAEVQQVIEKYPPALIVIDQLSKIHVAGRQDKNELETYRLQRLGEWVRQLSKDYCPVLYTIWADGSAEGQQWIEMSQLYGSKTGLQGECDAIITIGRKNDEATIAAQNNRYINICKNKMMGNDESLRNGKFEVQLVPTKARFK